MKSPYSSFASLGLLLFLGFSSFILWWPPLSSPTQSARQFAQNLVQTPTCLYGVEVDSLEVVQAAFAANENLSEVLARYNVSQQQIFQIASLPRDLFDVRRLQANKPYTILYRADSQHTAQCFVYHPNPIDYVRVDLGDSLWVERGQNPVDTVEHELSGAINSSLSESVAQSGGNAMLVHALANVYAWEINFFGLQKGDSYRVIYTTYEVEGKKAGFGKILAATFTHQKRPRIAIRYDQGQGPEYFDECGNSLRKTFLKAPLQYARISSHFSYSRLHPILKIRRPHLGVDYAARRGTPVVAEIGRAHV